MQQKSNLNSFQSLAPGILLGWPSSCGRDFSGSVQTICSQGSIYRFSHLSALSKQVLKGHLDVFTYSDFLSLFLQTYQVNQSPQLCQIEGGGGGESIHAL